MKIKLLRNTFINGEFIESGKIVDVDMQTARLVIGAKKAIEVKKEEKEKKMTTGNTEIVDTKKGKNKKK